MRPATACSRCRDRKRKCMVLDKGKSCRRCKSMKLKCSFARDNTQTRSQDTSPVPTYSFYPKSEEVFPDQSICDELVDIYFDFMHDKQHALFHRPSFIAKQRQGRAPKVLVSAIMALAARHAPISFHMSLVLVLMLSRFSTNAYFHGTDPCSRGQVWAEYARYLFNTRSEPVSLITVQTCSILSSISFVEGDIDSESLYGALAIRMVQLLDLPNKLSLDRLQRETEIRVWWTIWMMDSWSSAGAKLPKHLVVDASYPHPMEESSYEALEAETDFLEDLETMENASEGRDCGLWAQMIPLTQIMTQIVELNESTVQNRKSRSEIHEEVENIGNKLDSWLLRLPKDLQITPENLERYLKAGHGRTLIALHLGFHHHSQVLYFRFLHQSAEASDEGDLTSKYAIRCKESASELSNLLWFANSTPGYECLWVVTGHLLVISSSIHLHTLLFNNDDVEIENAKSLLKQNFEMMISLRKYWPSLDLSMSRLRAFHRACRESMHTCFSMDQWMTLFLQRYMKAISDRVEPSPTTNGFDLSEWPTPVQGFGSEFGTTEDIIDHTWWYGTEQQGSGSEILKSFL